MDTPCLPGGSNPIQSVAITVNSFSIRVGKAMLLYNDASLEKQRHVSHASKKIVISFLCRMVFLSGHYVVK
jgi:hypothetical protein